MFPLFQLEVAPSPVATPILPSVSDVLSDPIALLVLSIFGFALAVVVLIFSIRALLRRRVHTEHAFDMKVLLVRVPKETKQEDANAEKSQQQIQEMIGHMETVFSTLGSLRTKHGIGSWFTGHADTFSFEIVSVNDKVSFYVAIPSEMQHFIEEQIHAQYPNAQIDPVPDYNIFTPKGVVLGSYLTFKRGSYFPIKTYRSLETDSINSLTNALAKIEQGDGAAIQFIVRSSGHGHWRKEGIRIAKAMQQGKRLEEVLHGGGLLSLLSHGIHELITPKSKEEKEKPKESYRLSPREEEMVKGLEEKAAKAGLDINVRIVVSAKTPERSQRYLNDILNSFGQFNIYEYGNSFSKQLPMFQKNMIRHFIYRHFDQKYHVGMSAEELATIYHLPLPITETPKINWLYSRKAPAPTNIPTEGLLLGHSEYRGHNTEIRIKSQDRRRHMYIIGKSGSGKTEMMKAMAQQDILEGRGVCIIDPHGDFAEDALEFVPKERADDVVFFDPGDYERPMGLNMLEFDPNFPQQKTFVINEMLKIFDKLYDLKATGGPMFEQYMRNSILLLMDHPESGCTLMEIPKVLADEDFRNFKLSKCKSQDVKDFWQKEALKAGGESSLANMVPYITSKLSPFIYNDYMRPIIGQQKSAFNVFDLMNQQKILILKLSKGKIGELNAYLIGMVLVGKILMASLGRGDMDPKDRKDFYLYIDEFQNFLTDSISAILSEARKYGLDLIIAHQFIGQLEKTEADKQILKSIFGNVGTMFINRIGVEDAEFIAKEFAPVFTEYDLVNVEAFTFNAKILIDNQASRPFNFHPITAKRPPTKELANMIRELSRYKYGRKRELVEAEIRERRESTTDSLLGDDLNLDDLLK